LHYGRVISATGRRELRRASQVAAIDCALKWDNALPVLHLLAPTWVEKSIPLAVASRVSRFCSSGSRYRAEIILTSDYADPSDGQQLALTRSTQGKPTILGLTVLRIEDGQGQGLEFRAQRRRHGDGL
jgi:hypothetical protein